MKPKYQKAGNQRSGGFTFVELVTVLAVLTLLGPALARNSITATGVTCLDNLRRLNLAWQLYATESGGKLVNNLGIGEMGTVSDATYLNWTHNIMDWSTNPSNTNLTHAAASQLFPHLEGGVSTFKCPADRFKSAQQSQAGRTIGRLRSYSMNGFMGPFSRNGSDSTYKGLMYSVPV